MSLENTTKMANRYGLNLTLTNIADESDTATIEFANEVSIEVTGEITWATGGQGHVNMIGFKDPKEGTLTISTQIVPVQLLHLLAGNSLTTTGTTVSFKNDPLLALKYYRITGETVWQDENGVVYNESITAYKCLPRPNYSVTYNGSGDPVSIEVVFELASDNDKNFLDITRSEQGGAAGSNAEQGGAAGGNSGQ